MERTDLMEAMEIMARLTEHGEQDEVLDYARYKIALRSEAADDAEGGEVHAQSDCA